MCLAHIADAHFRAAADGVRLPPGCPGAIPRAPFNADDTEAAPEREVGGINPDTPFFCL
jgi:hypothetical protein